MRIYVCLFVVFCVTATPAQAFLAEKLGLFRSLKDGLGGDSNFGRSNGGGYGSGYNNGYTYSAPSRPLYTGDENYGYNYGRAASYNTGNVGGEQVIKVIKVVVPAQATTYSSSGYAGSSWTPLPQPQPQPNFQVVASQTPQVYAAQPVQVSPPVQVQYEQPAPVQVRVAQPAPVRVYAPQPVQYEQQAPVQVRVAQPVPVQATQVRVAQPAPQPVVVRNSVVEQPQAVVKTVRLIVSEVDDNTNGGYTGGYNQYYGPTVSNGYGYGGNQNGGSWNQGWNNIPANLLNKSWKSGGVWEKLGC